MLLDDVQAYLVSNDITPVYKGMLPDPAGSSPELAVALFEYTGMEPVWVQPLDQETAPVPKYEQPRIQIEARGNKEDYVSARTLAWTVFTLITQLVNVPLNGTQYQSVHPLQSPFFLRWDQNRRPIFTFNCEVFKAFG